MLKFKIKITQLFQRLADISIEMSQALSIGYKTVKKKWQVTVIIFVLGILSLVAHLSISIGTEPPSSSSTLSLGKILAAQGGQQHFINSFFTEETLTVTKEGDGFLPGTLRTVLLQAAGIRHHNPFTLVKITFDPTVKRIGVIKGNLPALEEGLITLDCANHVILDGTSLDRHYLNEGEQPSGLMIRSSGNFIKGCQFVGFGGPAIVLAGNRNQIRENSIGTLAGQNQSQENSSYVGPAIYITEPASENLIESNEILGNKQEGITFSPQVGSGNRIVSNFFQDSVKKAINGNENFNRSSRPVLRPIVKEGDSFIISGQAADQGEIELYMVGSNGKDGRISLIPPFSTGRGDFSVSVKNKGFIPGTTQIIALATATGRNTSEFSDAVVIPVESAKSGDSSNTLSPSPQPSPVEGEGARREIEENNFNSESNDSNNIKPMNQQAGSALSAGPRPAPSYSNGSATTPNPSIPPASVPPTIDPFLNSTTIPPPSIPPGSRSSSSDSIHVDSINEDQ
jgi:hypothetical protein